MTISVQSNLQHYNNEFAKHRIGMAIIQPQPHKLPVYILLCL